MLENGYSTEDSLTRQAHSLSAAPRQLVELPGPMSSASHSLVGAAGPVHHDSSYQGYPHTGDSSVDGVRDGSALFLSGPVFGLSTSAPAPGNDHGLHSFLDQGHGTSPVLRGGGRGSPSSEHREGRGTLVWFDELGGAGATGSARETASDSVARAVESVGEVEFARARAPLFEKAVQPHHFTPDERRRMDRYESIDYDEPQSFLRKAAVVANAEAAERHRHRRGGLKWLMFIAIGVVVGLWAVLVYQTLDYLADVKFDILQESIRASQRARGRKKARATTALRLGTCEARREDASVNETLCSSKRSPYDARAAITAALDTGLSSSTGVVDGGAILYGYVVYALWSVVAAMLSSLCCVVVPSAAGSGIPDVMAYLNGIMFPRIFNIRNLVVKSLSCILAVSAGLPVGTEGPMVHIGALIGAGLPTARSRSLHFGGGSGGTAQRFGTFRNAKDERDFISAGAACGLTSAFSSPLGGMLFVAEEIATFFPVRLAWMVLVSCLSCMCITQYVNTHLRGWAAIGTPAESVPSGNFRDSAVAMLYLGTVPENKVAMNALTFVPTIVVAALTGFVAVLYTVHSVRFSRWRARRLCPRPVLRVLEPGVMALLFATACYGLPLLLSGCRDIPEDLLANQKALNVRLVTAFCRTGSSLRQNADAAAAGGHGVYASSSVRQYHPLATLTLTDPYNQLRLLLSRRTQGLFPASALLVHLVVYAAGSSYAGGMFISCGTVVPSLLIGAVSGRLVGELFHEAAWADPGVLALVGAGAHFAGISRLTFSLIVIMLELTADLTHVTCLMLGAILAKAIADRYCHSLYVSTLEVKAAPLLEMQTSMHDMDTYCARDIASAPVVTLNLMESVVHVMEVLHVTTHNAFPVESPVNGAFVGVVTRTQLQQLLWAMYFREEDYHGDNEEREAQEGQVAAAAVGYDILSALPASAPARERHAADPVAAAPPAIVDSSRGSSGAAEERRDAQSRRRRWVHTQRHATVSEFTHVRETVFWERLPAMPPADSLPADVAQSLVDLGPYVDVSPPYVLDVTCVSRAYYLLRHTGLRHLPVLDRHMRVVGILTRTCFVGDRLHEKVARAGGQGRPLFM